LTRLVICETCNLKRDRVMKQNRRKRTKSAKGCLESTNCLPMTFRHVLVIDTCKCDDCTPLNASRYFCENPGTRGGGGWGCGGLNSGMCFKVREHVQCAKEAERKVLKRLAMKDSEKYPTCSLKSHLKKSLTRPDTRCVWKWRKEKKMEKK